MAPQTSSNTPNVQTDGKAKVAIADDAILVDDKLYSWSKLAADHPGGELFVKSFAGRDATEAFLSYHRRPFPHSSKAHAQIGEVSPHSNEYYTDDYLELCAEVDKVLPRNKCFAPFIYWVKLVTLLTVTVCLEMHMHNTGDYRWYYCGVLGLCFAFIGLNVQHDANHGSISRSPLINRLLGMSQNYIGGSAVSWIHQHVVQHHIHCNDVREDPDIMGGNLIRLNPLKPILSNQAWQYIYVFIMIGGFGLKQIFTTVGDTISGKNFTSYSKPVRKDHFVFELFTSILFGIRWVILPAYWGFYSGRGVLTVLLSTLPMYVVAGYYLAFFFIISHNFEGAHAFDRRKHLGETPSASSVNRFLYRQVASSSNVGGPILAFFNGGLNYQIEHHLFPRVQHTHYATIAPVVRDFCNRKGIPYKHFPTIADNFLSCSRHLFRMGTTQNMEMID